MVGFFIILGAIIAVLFIFLTIEDAKCDKLLDENGHLKGLIAGIEKQQQDKHEPLTVEKIADAVRFAGYVPQVKESAVFFMDGGDRYCIDADQLPQISLDLCYKVDPNEWDVDLLKEAAHQMSDKLFIIKALFSEDETGSIILRFLVAAFGRDDESFKQDLVNYLRIIDEGTRMLHEIYEKLVKAKRDEAMRGTKVLS